MPRRVNLPGASELFGGTRPDRSAPAGAPVPPADGAAPPAGRGSGRVRHEEKITVYVSREELLALEQARLTLRQQGLAADRGRIVREAIAALLADLAERGTDSELARRLAGPSTSPAEPVPEPPA